MGKNEQINISCEHHSGHNHEHHDLHQNCCHPEDGISSRTQGGALVCSGNRHVTGDLEQLKKNLKKELSLLDKWVEEEGGITGHIKSVLSVNGPVFKVSAISGEVECEDLGFKNMHISIAAIVFQIKQESLEVRIESLFNRLSQ